MESGWGGFVGVKGIGDVIETLIFFFSQLICN